MIHSQVAFETAHIPGSSNFHPHEHPFTDLPQDKDRDVVVYCTDVACVASQMAYHAMVAEGYTNVRRCGGGLSDWADSGYEFATGDE